MKVPSGGIGAVLALLRIAVEMLTEMHGQRECLTCGSVIDAQKTDEHRETCTHVYCTGCKESVSVDSMKEHLKTCEKHPAHQAIAEAVAAERERVEGEFDRWREE